MLGQRLYRVTRPSHERRVGASQRPMFIEATDDGDLRDREVRLRRYVSRRCRNPADVDDIVQETLMRTIEQSRQKTIENPLAYAYRVADSIIFQESRRQKRLSDMPERELECDMPSVEQACDFQLRYKTFANALAEMPALRRDVFLKRHVDGLGRQEIATQMGLSVEAVKKHLVRARLDLAEIAEAIGFAANSANTDETVKTQQEQNAREGSGA